LTLALQDPENLSACSHASYWSNVTTMRRNALTVLHPSKSATVASIVAIRAFTEAFLQRGLTIVEINRHFSVSLIAVQSKIPWFWLHSIAQTRCQF
jgi:hypothetical protein